MNNIEEKDNLIKVKNDNLIYIQELKTFYTKTF